MQNNVFNHESFHEYAETNYLMYHTNTMTETDFVPTFVTFYSPND